MRKTVYVDIPEPVSRKNETEITYQTIVTAKKPLSAKQIADLSDLNLFNVRTYLSKMVRRGMVLEVTCKSCDSCKVYAAKR